MYILPVHIGSFIITITSVIIADIHALLWVIGKLQTLSHRRMITLHNIVSIGLFVSITSGIIMFWPLREYLLTVTAFWVKMIFVVALVINSFIIARHVNIPTTRTFVSLTKNEQRPLIVSGLVSTVSWIGAFTSALFLGI